MCFLADLNSTADEQFDALLLSNVVPMYPEFKSELLVRAASENLLLNFPLLL